MKPTEPQPIPEWSVSPEIEKARQDWEKEFQSRKARISGELSKARERVELMALNTVKSAESELPEKIAALSKEALAKTEEAEERLRMLKTKIDSIPLDSMADRFFEQITGRSGGPYG